MTGVNSTTDTSPHINGERQLHSQAHSCSPGSQVNRIVRALLPHKATDSLWDITISDGSISAIDPHDATRTDHGDGTLDASARLLAPSLCHSHIHLDKCFLLSDAKFASLEITQGSFAEAMALTATAKAHFEEEDLLRRGRYLIEESIAFGVTVMRAFVEVDDIVHFKCLRAGLALKKEYCDRCEIQLCAFAQLPLFSGDGGGTAIRKLMEAAVRTEGVDAVGSAPYVEVDDIKANMNLRWMTMLAHSHRKCLDFHLDYHLDTSKEPLIWSAIEALKDRNWSQRSGEVAAEPITVSHCTRLSFFKAQDWTRLKQGIGDLPISLIALPTSDLFMMRTSSRAIATLNVPQLVKSIGIDASIAVNNVGNAFTPQGSCDPLGVATLGVGLYQAATKVDTDILYVNNS